ncbi:MAG: DUF5320 domain-containing protein [Desulfitobacteriia bacterium]|jgi:hypothetical protein
MPGGDGTGPLGYGPLTGRGVGFCYDPWIDRPVFFGRRGMARGFHRGCWGLGLRRMDYALSDRDYLSQQAELLESRLQWVKKRLNELDEADEKNK